MPSLLRACVLSLSIALPALGSTAPQEPTTSSETTGDGLVVQRTLRALPDGSQVLDGEFRVASAEGKSLVVGEYKLGARSGRWRYRHPNGELAAVGAYREGQRFGAWQHYHTNGAKRAAGRYADDAPTGRWLFYDEQAKLLPELTGELVAFDRALDGSTLRCRGQRLDGELHGPVRVTWPDGSPFIEATYERGEVAGAPRLTLPGGIESWTMHGVRPASEARDLDVFWGLDSHGRIAVPASSTRQPSPRESLASLAGALRVPQPERNGAAAVTAKEFVASQDVTLRESFLGRLRGMAPNALAWALGELRGIDWTSSSDAARARVLVERLVDPLLAGLTFSWDWNGGGDAADANRRALLRCHAAAILVADHPAFWSLELAAESRGGSLGEQLEGLSMRAPIGRWLGEVGAPSEASASLEAGLPSVLDAHRHALRWLASTQAEDGSWSAGTAQGRGHVSGVTALAVLALMSDGSTLDEGAHSQAVARGVSWLLRAQDSEAGTVHFIYVDGAGQRFRSAQWIYDQALSTLALCAALEGGWTPALERRAMAAVRVLLRARNPYGAWRYAVPPNGDNDTSVTGWVARALLAAERVGIPTDANWRLGAVNWVNELTDPGNARVGYDSLGSLSARYAELNTEYPPDKGEAMTAVGASILMSCAASDELPARALQMLERLDRCLPMDDPAGRVGNDVYYWYFGTLAMRMAGKSRSRAWAQAMQATAVQSQQVELADGGSWDPSGPWGMVGGRVYATSLMALIAAELLRP